ncbi:hypothetical protein R0I01_11675 [Bacillus pumilus]|nr:hypothetical protein R0I01_11675 [Bacillus pumilus]
MCRRHCDSRANPVVVAALDPTPLVAGRGIAILQDAGIQVITAYLNRNPFSMNEVVSFYYEKTPFS